MNKFGFQRARFNHMLQLAYLNSEPSWEMESDLLELETGGCFCGGLGIEISCNSPINWGKK